MAERKLIVVTAPSGAGKTSIVQHIKTRLPQLQFLISATTRPPRAQEQHGKDYYFVTESAFHRMIQNEQLAEYEEVYPGTFYGTPRAELERGKGPAVLDVDVKGAHNLRNHYPNTSLILFVKPPSLQVLEERLRQRATESETSIQARLLRAKEEMRYATLFDGVIVNDNLDKAVEEVVQMICAFLDR